MKHGKTMFAFTIGVLLVAGALRAADQPKDSAKAPVAWTRKATKDLPKNRTGGMNTTKAAGVSDAALFFIAPKTTGLTTRELPVVYWYISAPAKDVTFTLVRFDTKKTQFKLQLGDVQPGFHKLDLGAQAKRHKLTPLEGNDWAPAGEGAPALSVLYRMTLSSPDLKIAATAFIARVKAPAGGSPDDAGIAIQNELWFDAVSSLANDLGAKGGNASPRKQFEQMLAVEEVLRSDVSDSAPAQEKKSARAVEEKVFNQLSVPDPIDIQSDEWKPYSVPDPTDI